MLYNSAMDIFLKGCDHKYAVEQMLLTLYPDERPVYPEAPGGADRVEISLRRGGKYASAVCRLSREGKTPLGRPGSRSAARKRPLMRSVSSSGS